MKTFYQRHKNKLKILAMFALVVGVLAVCSQALAFNIGEQVRTDLYDFGVIARNIGGAMPAGAANPFTALALSMVALYFVIEVITKSVSIDKISIEMVVKLLLRLLIARVLVENATTIMWDIHDIFLTFTEQVVVMPLTLEEGGMDLRILDQNNPLVMMGQTGGGIFLRWGGIKDMIDTMTGKGVIGAAVWAVAVPLITVVLSQLISSIAGQQSLIFVPFTLVELRWVTLFIVINIIVTWLVVALTRLSIWFTLWQRNMELIILSFLAPLAMAGFVSEEFKAGTKKFVLSFAAVCLQGAVIVLITRIMGALFHGSGLAMMSEGAATGDGGQIFAGFLYMTGLATQANVGTALSLFSGGAIFNPIIAMINNIVYPILLAMMIGKSRQIATTILGV